MLRFSANVSILFTEAPFIERFAQAAKHGFRGVECWFPYDHDKATLAAEIASHSLQVIAINAPPGDLANAEFGLAIFRERRDAFLASIVLALDYAVALNSRFVHVLAGNLPEGASNTDLVEFNATYIEHLQQAADLAKRCNKTLLIEPLNPTDRPRYFLSSIPQAAEVLRAVQRDNVALMFDVYHVQMNGGNLVNRLREHLAQIGHIQIADVPGRHEPGTGEINFPFLFEAIAASGYRGWIGCEYQPRTHTDVIPFLHQYETRRDDADSANARQGGATTYRIDLEMK